MVYASLTSQNKRIIYSEAPPICVRNSYRTNRIYPTPQLLPSYSTIRTKLNAVLLLCRQICACELLCHLRYKEPFKLLFTANMFALYLYGWYSYFRGIWAAQRKYLVLLKLCTPIRYNRNTYYSYNWHAENKRVFTRNVASKILQIVRRTNLNNLHKLYA